MFLLNRQPPVRFLRYFRLNWAPAEKTQFGVQRNTGVSADDYLCTVGSVRAEYTTVAASSPVRPAVWTYKNGPTWWFAVKVPGVLPVNPSVGVDIVCFHHGMTQYQPIYDSGTDPASQAVVLNAP
jgi:hypothetical protein